MLTTPATRTLAVRPWNVRPGDLLDCYWTDGTLSVLRVTGTPYQGPPSPFTRERRYCFPAVHADGPAWQAESFLHGGAAEGWSGERVTVRRPIVPRAPRKPRPPAARVAETGGGAHLVSLRVQRSRRFKMRRHAMFGAAWDAANRGRGYGHRFGHYAYASYATRTYSRHAERSRAMARTMRLWRQAGVRNWARRVGAIV